MTSVCPLDYDYIQRLALTQHGVQHYSRSQMMSTVSLHLLAARFIAIDDVGLLQRCFCAVESVGMDTHGTVYVPVRANSTYSCILVRLYRNGTNSA